MFRLLFIISTQWFSAEGFYTNWLKRGRIVRRCHEASTPPSLVLEDSKFGIFMVSIAALLLIFIFLGLIKGLLGLFFDKVGMYGLNLLIDLPRPLPRYQEKNLRYRPVVYDVGGWPVHPDTLQRTIRVLPKRTEFCLNLIFFLAYPLAACVYLCAFLCCIRNLRPSKDDTCFKHVDVVRLTNHDELKNNKEEEDTKYVMEAMEKSRDSMREINCGCLD